MQIASKYNFLGRDIYIRYCDYPKDDSGRLCEGYFWTNECGNYEIVIKTNLSDKATWEVLLHEFYEYINQHLGCFPEHNNLSVAAKTTIELLYTLGVLENEPSW
jgi:hypothetical protein